MGIEISSIQCQGAAVGMGDLLLHICDLYDTALCLQVLWILHSGGTTTVSWM